MAISESLHELQGRIRGQVLAPTLTINFPLFAHLGCVRQEQDVKKWDQNLGNVRRLGRATRWMKGEGAVLLRINLSPVLGGDPAKFRCSAKKS